MSAATACSSGSADRRSVARVSWSRSWPLSPPSPLPRSWFFWPSSWVVLGWRPGPDGSVIGLVVAVGMTTLVGAAAFAGLGLLIAGTVRPEAALVLANALFLVALMVGGVLVPVQDLPGPLASIAGLLPVGALAEAFGASLGSGGSLAINLGIVAAWGVVALVGAARTFRWE